MSKSGKNQPKADKAKSDQDGGLSLEDTLSQNARGLKRAPKTGKSGYNPYDAAPIAKKGAKDNNKKPTDLRKLSEWIRLRREVEELNKNPAEPEDPEDPGDPESKLG